MVPTRDRKKIWLLLDHISRSIFPQLNATFMVVFCNYIRQEINYCGLEMVLIAFLEKVIFLSHV